MGIFGKIGSSLFTPIRAPLQALFGKEEQNQLPSEYGEAPMDPRIRDQTTRMSEQANKFTEQLPGYKAQQRGLAEEMARRDMNSGVQNVKAGMNSRGLLYSGLRGSSEAAERQKVGSALSRKIADMNAGAEDQANQMTSDATSGRIGLEEMITKNSATRAKQEAKMSQGQGGIPLFPEITASNRWAK